MKKLIISILAAVAMLSGSVASVSAKDNGGPEYTHFHPLTLIGDADGNGVVDSIDGTITLQCVILNNNSPVKTRFDDVALYNWKGCLYVAPNGQSMNINLTNADYNCDKFVTNEDATLILQAFLDRDMR